MKIHGIGVDIVKIGRIKKSLNNTKFKTRIFSIEEVNRCKKNVKQENCFAKKFAAKEAFSKALGTGFRDQLNFKNIEIKNDKLGKPYISKNITLNKLIKKKFKINKYNIFLSISDEKNYAVANVIITK